MELNPLELYSRLQDMEDSWPLLAKHGPRVVQLPTSFRYRYELTKVVVKGEQKLFEYFKKTKGQYYVETLNSFSTGRNDNTEGT